MSERSNKNNNTTSSASAVAEDGTRAATVASGESSSSSTGGPKGASRIAESGEDNSNTNPTKSSSRRGITTTATSSSGEDNDETRRRRQQRRQDFGGAGSSSGKLSSTLSRRGSTGASSGSSAGAGIASSTSSRRRKNLVHRSNSQPKLVVEEPDDLSGDSISAATSAPRDAYSETIRGSDSGVSGKVSLFEEQISKSKSAESASRNSNNTTTTKNNSRAVDDGTGGKGQAIGSNVGGSKRSLNSSSSSSSSLRRHQQQQQQQQPASTTVDSSDVNTAASSSGFDTGAFAAAFPSSFASPSSLENEAVPENAAFASFADMAVFSPNSNATGDQAFSSAAFDTAFASEPQFTTATATTTTSTTSDFAFAADFDPHVFQSTAFDPAFDLTGASFAAGGETPLETDTTVWDKTPWTDLPTIEPEQLVLQAPQTVLTQKQFHGTPVCNPTTGTILFCTTTDRGVVTVHEVDPSRNFMQIASTPVLTPDLRRKMVRKYSATVTAIDRVWCLACSSSGGGGGSGGMVLHTSKSAQPCTLVAAVMDLHVLESTTPVRIIAVWQWSQGQSLQYVLTPPSGGDYCYDLTTLQVSHELCFLAGASPKGACVFVSQPAVREAWSANFLTGAPGTICSMAVAPHQPYLVVALTDSSVTVWTFRSALQKESKAATSTATTATKRWLFPLCRLQHAKAMAVEKPAVVLSAKDESSTSMAGNDDPGRCTHLSWLSSDSMHPNLQLLAVGFENGFAVFHVELPILADGYKPLPEPTQSTVVSATPSLRPIAVKRWLGPVEFTNVSWIRLGPHVDPLIAVLMVNATQAQMLLCAINIPLYSATMVTKTNVLPCRILATQEVPKDSDSFPGGLLPSGASPQALLCYSERKLSAMKLVSPSTQGLSPAAMFDFPVTSIPPGLSSFGDPFLVDAVTDRDGILHIFSTVHCERYQSGSEAALLPWSAPMRRTWLCRSVVGDTRETFVEETKEKRGFGDSAEAFGGASASVIVELNHELLRGMSPCKIIRCIGSSVCAVLFRSAFASPRAGSGNAMALMDADTIALVNFDKETPVVQYSKGRDICIFPSDDANTVRGLILSVDGSSLTFFDWTCGNDCELNTSYRPIVGVDSDKDYIDCKGIDLFVDGSKLALNVLGKRNQKVCLVTGEVCDLSDATSEAWSKLLPNIVTGRSTWLNDRERVFAMVGLQGDGNGYRNFALATSKRVLILTSALTIAAETKRRVSSGNLVPIGNFAVTFSSQDKVRYLCCLDEELVESAIATLSDKSSNTLLAVRPDRLILSPTQTCPCLVEPDHSPNSFSIPAPSTRVALLLEPLVANAVCVGGKINKSTVVLRNVIEKFGRKVASITHGEKEGIGQQGAGLSSKTFAILHRYRLKHAASWLLTGTPKFERSVNSEILPPWIPVCAKAQGAVNNDAILHVLCNGDSYLSEYIKSPGQNMPAPLPRHNDATANLSREFGRAAIAAGKGLDAMQLLDLAGSDSTESFLLLLSLLLEKKNGQYCATGVLESLSGGKESDFARSSKTEKFASSLAALALVLKKAQSSSDVSMPKDQIDRHMKALAPSIQRAQGFGRPRQRLLVEKDIEKAAGKADDLDSDSIWATPCNESKHVWNEGPRREKENLLLVDSVEDWLGRRRPLILGREGASAAKDRGEKTLADILNQDDDSFGNKGDDLESVKGDTWAMGVGEGRSDEANLSSYFRFSEGEEAKSSWKTEGLLDLSPYQNKAVIVGEPEAFSLQQSTSSVDEGETGKVKSLFDLVFEKSGVDKPSGLALPASRGSSTDVGTLHGPGADARKRCSIEFWFYLPNVSVITNDIVLARRTMGSSADDLTKVSMAANKECVLWELLLLKSGELEFRTCGGSSLLSTQKKAMSEVDDADDDDEDSDNNKEKFDLAIFDRWNHVCIVLSSKNLSISECVVSLYMKGVEVASSKTSMLPPGLADNELKHETKLNDLLQKSYLLFGLNHVVGYRMTELRVWACKRSADDTYTFLYEYLTAAEQKKKFKVKISHKNKKGAQGRNLGLGLSKTGTGGDAQLRTMTAKSSLKDTGISLAPQFSLAPPKPSENASRNDFSPEPTGSTRLGPTAFNTAFTDFGGSPSSFSSPSAIAHNESLPVVKEDADEDDKEPDQEIEGETKEEDVAETLWDTALPLSQQIRASAAAALIRGPPATRHYGGNRGGLPDYSGVDRFGVGGIAICGSEKTIVFRDNEDPPALTYPIGASGAVVSDQMDDDGSEFLCCFLAKEGRMVVFELRSRTVVVELQMTTKLNFWRYLPPEAAQNTLCFMLVTPVGGFHWMPLEESPRPHQVWKRGAELQGKKIVCYEEGGSNGLDDAAILSRVGLVMTTRSSGASSLEGWLVPISGNSQAQQVSADMLGACLCQPVLAEDGPFLPLLVTVHSIKNGTWVNVLSIEEPKEGSLALGEVLASELLDEDESSDIEYDPPGLAMGLLPEALCVSLSNIVVVILRRKGFVAAFELEESELNLIAQENVGHYVIDAVMRYSAEVGGAEIVMLLSDGENPKDGRIVSFCFRSAV